jgi:hypothetical protein
VLACRALLRKITIRERRAPLETGTETGRPPTSKARTLSETEFPRRSGAG